MGFNFYHDYASPTILLGFLLSLWMWEYLFLVGSSILLSMAVQQLVGILLLLQEMNACPLLCHLELEATGSYYT